MRKDFSKIQLIIKVFIICAFLFSFVSYAYMDFIATQRHGIEVWSALFSGNIRRFYYYCAENTDCLAVYDFTVYLIFAIWNFPLWIYECITGIDAQTLPIFIIYGKGVVFVFFIGCIYVFRKIIEIANIQQKEESVFLQKPELQLLVSALLTVYSLYTGNYDIIALFFILLGLLFLLKNKKIPFLLMFSIAFSAKFFALWVFIPIVLLYEKKVIKIISYLMSIGVVSVLENLLLQKSRALKMLNINDFSATGSINLILDAGKTEMFGGGVVSMCIIAYALLCIWCYFGCFMENKKEDTYRIFYVCFLSWMIFFSFVQYNSYWIVLYVPFMMFIVLYDDNKLGVNIILEMILSVSLYLAMNIRQFWIVGFPTVFGISENLGTNAGLLGSICLALNGNITEYFCFSEYLYDINGEYNLYCIFQSFAIAVSIALVIINHPRYEIKFKCTETTINMLYRMRVIVNLSLLVIPPILFILGQFINI